eukprot:jgi/Bigna1/131992/aug1.16_g6700
MHSRGLFRRAIAGLGAAPPLLAAVVLRKHAEFRSSSAQAASSSKAEKGERDSGTRNSEEERRVIFQKLRIAQFRELAPRVHREVLESVDWPGVFINIEKCRADDPAAPVAASKPGRFTPLFLLDRKEKFARLPSPPPAFHHTYLVFFKIKPLHAAAFTELLLEECRTVQRVEPGMLRYDLYRHSEDSCKFLVYEVCEDDDAMAAHENRRADGVMRRTIAEMEAISRKKIKETGRYYVVYPPPRSP